MGQTSTPGRPLRVALLLLLLMFGQCLVASGETPAGVVNPKAANNTWVSDMAHVLDAATERRLNTLINGLERQSTAEIAVVTIRRSDGLTPKQFATRLFNQWGIGKRGKDNGVLMLVVMEARRIEVETGNGMERRLPDAQVQRILRERVVPRFKEDDYNGGIFAGVQAIAGAITRPVATSATSQQRAKPRPMQQTAPSPPLLTEPPTPKEPPYDTPPSFEVSPAPSVNWAPFALGGGLVTLGACALFRFRIRRCPLCRQPMRLVPEAEDDAQLAVGQCFEESIGSVDYRVFRCDRCETSKLERAARWFSGYSDCPGCNHRTLQSETHVLSHPTYDWEGESLTTRSCHFPGCTFHDSQRRILPRRTRPSSTSSGSSHSSSSGSSSGSSSSRSFGGGSSNGGGAGASW